MLMPLYSAAQVRELDRRAIASGTAGAELMTRAGEAVLRCLRARYPRARRIAVVCGPGNNGGDGYVVAFLAKQMGLEPSVLTLGRTPAISSDAATMRARCEAAGIAASRFEAAALREAEVIVDAMLGTGLERPVQGEWHDAVDAINASAMPAIAVDIPSGLHADTGAVLGAAVRAEVTLSFIGLKPGLFTGAGREYTGDILFDDLGIPPHLYKDVVPTVQRMTQTLLGPMVAARTRDAHKGNFGHVLVLGGGPGMSGAPRLCAQAAARIGAGLVTLATHPQHAPLLNAAQPELLCYAARSAKVLKPLFARANVIALGPGLSQDAWARGIYRAALAATLPLVLDADALNLLAKAPTRRNDWILTPHPGEAARLLKTTTAKIQQDRLDAARKIVKRYGGVCVLKGAGTLIASSENDIWLCDRGNPGMASGGTGDVLTGVIAGLRAQSLAPLDAARLGVWLHASAGDVVAQHDGEIGLLAGDLIPVMRRELNRLAR